jgi:hypothetical protein
MLTFQAHEFISLLSKRGYMWPSDKRLCSLIIAELSRVRPERNIRVTAVPGWHGQSFALPGESYGPNGPNRKTLRIMNNPNVCMGEFQRSGTLGKWKKRIAKKCMHSSRARLAVATVFAAPILRILEWTSFGINFSGGTWGDTGLLVRLAASAAGLNRNGSLATWDGMPAAFAQRALGHRDCIMPLGNISYLDGDPLTLVNFITLRLPGNRAKQKADRDVAAQNLVDVDARVIALSTSEDSVWKLDKPKPRPIRCAELRVINVPLGSSDVENIFDGPDAAKAVGKTIKERRRYVEGLERDALKCQGEPFRAYLKKLTADKRVRAALKAHVADYAAAAPLPSQKRWVGRIQRCFALCYAGAAQAIDYGILPWSKKATLRAIRVCMDDTMAQLNAAASKAAKLDAVMPMP